MEKNETYEAPYIVWREVEAFSDATASQYEVKGEIELMMIYGTAVGKTQGIAWDLKLVNLIENW